MLLNEQDAKPSKIEPFTPWEEEERVRPPWIAQKHGQAIPCQMDQKSNLKLDNAQVLQPRDEKVATSSQAPPISGRNDTGHGASDEQSGRKQIGPQSTGVSL